MTDEPGDIEDMSSRSMDRSLRLGPDGMGGVEFGRNVQSRRSGLTREQDRQLEILWDWYTGGLPPAGRPEDGAKYRLDTTWNWRIQVLTILPGMRILQTILAILVAAGVVVAGLVGLGAVKA